VGIPPVVAFGGIEVAPPEPVAIGEPPAVVTSVVAEVAFDGGMMVEVFEVTFAGGTMGVVDEERDVSVLVLATVDVTVELTLEVVVCPMAPAATQTTRTDDRRMTGE